MNLLKNATIIPLEGTMDSFTGGVYTSDGQFIEDSLLYRGKPAQLQKPVESFSSDKDFVMKCGGLVSLFCWGATSAYCRFAKDRI